VNDVKNINDVSKKTLEDIKKRYNINDTEIPHVKKLLWRLKCKLPRMSSSTKQIYASLRGLIRCGYELTPKQFSLLETLANKSTYTTKCGDSEILTNRKKSTVE